MLLSLHTEFPSFQAVNNKRSHTTKIYNTHEPFPRILRFCKNKWIETLRNLGGVVTNRRNKY